MPQNFFKCSGFVGEADNEVNELFYVLEELRRKSKSSFAVFSSLF